MRWLFYVLVFAIGFGAGAFRAGAPWRGIVASAVLLPAIVLVLAVLSAAVIALAPGGAEMRDLAAWSVAIFGAALAVIAFAGGLFGAWFRRAGKGRP